MQRVPGTALQVKSGCDGALCLLQWRESKGNYTVADMVHGNTHYGSMQH